ncbi:hypothetical protein INT47_007856 [Mucor saturninus]|uniref:Uncharacterized protein n=1 Tax=Mucor saturninus TaxID=64648 RepID=A0A8H7RD31_9FUNG|nr:hypothetical protein INT47_007856 [Mucor saturninus]
MKKHLKLDTSKRHHYFKFGYAVERLAIKSDSTIISREPGFMFDKNELIMVLGYLPNITTLDLSEYCYMKLYLQYILESTSTRILTKVSYIPPGQDISEELFATALFRYRKSITRLKLDYQQTNFIRKPPCILLSGCVIGQFLSLTHLDLQSSPEEELSTFNIQKMCPGLISLKYSRTAAIPSTTLEHIYQDPFYKKRSNLKTFELTVSAIPSNYNPYVIDYIAPQADTIMLNLVRMDLHKWISDIGMVQALSIVRSLSTLKSAGLCFILNKGHGNEIRTAANFFKLLKAFKGSRKLYSYALITDLRSYRDSMKYVFGNPILYTDSLDAMRNGLEFRYCMTQDATRSEYFDIIDSMVDPDAIISLRINTTEDKLEKDLVAMTEHVLSCCQNILYFEYKTISTISSQVIISADSFQGLVPGLDNPIVPSNTRKRLECVKTYGLSFNQDLLDKILGYVDIKFFSHYFTLSTLVDAGPHKMDFTKLEASTLIHLNIEHLPIPWTKDLYISIECGDKSKVFIVNLNAGDQSFKVDEYHALPHTKMAVEIKCREGMNVLFWLECYICVAAIDECRLVKISHSPFTRAENLFMKTM